MSYSASKDQDINVLGYPSMNYHPQPPQPAYSLPHQGYRPAWENSMAPSYHPSPSMPHYSHQHSNHGNPMPHYSHQHSNHGNPTQGYPPTPENPKGYSNVASFAYYKTQVYHPLERDHLVQESDNGTGFMQFLTVLLVILIGGLCAITLIIWLLFGTEVPDFHVASLTVPTFNISGTSLDAKWEADVTITNTNEKLEIYFSQGKSSIFYENQPLALEYMESFHMGKNVMGGFQPKLSTKETDPISEQLLQQLQDDRRNGNITFSLRMSIAAKFEVNSLWRKEKMKIFCEDLVVAFSDKTGVGTLTGDEPHECLIFT